MDVLLCVHMCREGTSKGDFLVFLPSQPRIGNQHLLSSSFIYRYFMCSLLHFNHDPGEPHTGVKEINHSGGGLGTGEARKG